MNRNRKNSIKIFSILFSAIYLFSPFLSLAPVSAQSVNSDDFEMKEKVEILAEKIVNGEKVFLNETIGNDTENTVENRYVIFVKKDESEQFSKKFPNSISDGTVFGEAAALTVQFDGNAKEQLKKLERSSDVIAITPVVRREISAYPNPPNDPLFPPSNNYSSSYQWYLNRPSEGNYGIDLLRAWQYLDSQEINYGGESEIVIAVIDSGVAFENYTKYDDEWEFGKATDLTDNIYINSGETGGNNLDDDNNGQVDFNYGVSSLLPYCIDLNDNGNCDLPLEATKSYFDDRNSFNVVDFERYWSVTPSNVSTSPNCGNMPSYKCVDVEDMQCELGNISRNFGCTPGDMGHANDTMGHGTFVSNVIAGKANNGTSGTGIAPGVSLLPIQIFSAKYDGSGSNWSVDGGYSDQIARAINYAVSAGADVINMSFGGASPDVYEELALNNAYYDNDVVLVAASGNKGNTQIQYPAGYESVIAVGATNKNASKVSYSSYGSHLELSAPVGSGIMSQSYTCYLTSGMWDSDGSGEACMASDTIANMNPSSGSYPPSILTAFSNGSSAGTSFAAPQVAAVAGLIRSLHPDWDALQVRSILRRSVSKIGGVPYSTSIGYGVLNAYNAVRAVDDYGNDLTLLNRTFQTMRGSSNGSYIRYSDDNGETWTSWSKDGNAYGRVTLLKIPSNGRILQAKRGKDNKVYTRYSSNDGLNWSSWSASGSSLGDINMVVAGSRVVQTTRGTNSSVYMRYSKDGGVTWTGWKESKKAKGNVSMIYDSSTSRVIQVMRGSNNGIYTRYSSNNAGSWTAWVKTGTTSSDISMVQAGSNVVQSMRGGNGRVYTRYTSNGGDSWSAWVSSVDTKSGVNVVFTGERVLQSARGSENHTLTRYSTNNGVSWSSWTESNKTSTEIVMARIPSLSRTFQVMRGLNGYLYTRFTDNHGQTWSPWEKSSLTEGDIFSMAVVIEEWD